MLVNWLAGSIWDFHFGVLFVVPRHALNNFLGFLLLLNAAFLLPVPVRFRTDTSFWSDVVLKGKKMRRIGLTVFRVHGEVGLSQQNAVDQLGAVPVRLIVGVARSDGDNSRTCPENTESRVKQQRSVKVRSTRDDKLLQNR